MRPTIARCARFESAQSAHSAHSAHSADSASAQVASGGGAYLVSPLEPANLQAGLFPPGCVPGCPLGVVPGCQLRCVPGSRLPIWVLSRPDRVCSRLPSWWFSRFQVARQQLGELPPHLPWGTCVASLSSKLRRLSTEPEVGLRKTREF